jgi:hypothetical protein
MHLLPPRGLQPPVLDLVNHECFPQCLVQQVSTGSAGSQREGLERPNQVAKAKVTAELRAGDVTLDFAIAGRSVAEPSIALDEAGDGFGEIGMEPY